MGSEDLTSRLAKLRPGSVLGTPEHQPTTTDFGRKLQEGLAALAAAHRAGLEEIGAHKRPQGPS